MNAAMPSAAQKSRLRGIGQRLNPALQLGRVGLSPAFLTELRHHLDAAELVKLRLPAGDRREREALCTRIADEGRCHFIGGIGRTALFYREQADPAKRVVSTD